jgi:hypothetical protein
MGTKRKTPEDDLETGRTHARGMVRPARALIHRGNHEIVESDLGVGTPRIIHGISHIITE